MPLQKNKIPISFAQGVDTKTDRKQVVPGKLLLLENGVFQTTNSLIKRNGYAAFNKSTTDNTTLANSIGVATFKDTLFNLAAEVSGATVTNTYGWAYSPSTLEYSSNKGVYHPVNVSRTAAGTTYYYNAPYTPGGGVPFVYASIDSYTDTTTNLQFLIYSNINTASNASIINFAFKDLTTNSFIISNTLLGGTGLTSIGSYFRALKIGTKFVVIFSGTYTGTPGLYYVTIDVSNLAVQSAPTLIRASGTTSAQYLANSRFDAIVDNNIIYVGYANGVAATNTLSLLTISSAFSISATTLVTGVNAAKGVAIAADASNNLWVGANSGLIVKAVGYTSNLAGSYFAIQTIYTSTDLTDVVAIVSPTSPTSCDFFVNQAPPSSVSYTDPMRVIEINCNFISPFIFTSFAASLMLNATITSKPFNYLNNTYLIVSSYDGLDTLSYYLLQTTSTPSQAAVAKMCVKSASDMAGNAVSIYPSSSGLCSLALIEKTTANASKSYVAWSYLLSFDHKPVFAEMANNLHITGGYIYIYDGKQLCEHGYLMNPTKCDIAVSGGSMPTGTYRYIYTYEWVDAFGQLHISEPSAPSNPVTHAGGVTLTATIPNLQLTNKQGSIFIGLYRSNDGTNYYKNALSGYNGVIVNNVGTASTTFADSDVYYNSLGTAILSYLNQPLLYTAGGVVENVNPGATRYLATYNQRLIAIPQEAPNSWWYSKQIIPGSPGAVGSPVNFSDVFISNIDERGGGIVGIQQIDEKLIYFKANSIYGLAGNGPAPNGTGDQFNPPQVIATDSGCIEGQSIVLGPSGIIYKSAKGLYLIDRSLSVSYIGAPVEFYNSQEILSADLIYNLNQFRFGISSGVALVYNYLFDQWSVFTNHPIVQACIYQNKYTYAKSDGTVYQETPGAYSDANTPISMKLTTGWLSFAELQGFQRLYKLLLLGEYKSAHKLQVDICVDFDDTPVQGSTITASPGQLYQYRIFLKRQKCQSMKFTIQDIAPDAGTLAEGYSISAMAFEMGVKQGLNKLPATRSVG